MRKILLPLLCAAGLWAADGPRRAPGFALPDAKMLVHDLGDYRGRPVVLEFMLTTCPHCIAFVPVLEKVQEHYGDRVAIVTIVNPPDNMTTVNQFVAKHGITYPVLFDMGQAAYSYVLRQSFSQPQLYLIDASGMIQRHYEYGPFTRDIFEGNGLYAELDRMLGGSAPAKK